MAEYEVTSERVLSTPLLTGPLNTTACDASDNDAQLLAMLVKLTEADSDTVEDAQAELEGLAQPDVSALMEPRNDAVED